MTKAVTICFRTTDGLKKALEALSAEDRRSLSSTIENILYEYLEKKEASKTWSEKRRFPRKNIAVPALVSRPGGGNAEPRAAVIGDISLGGLSLTLPGGSPMELSADGDNSRLSIIFTLPHIRKALTVWAVPRHVFRRDNETGIGMSFADADVATYQTLRTYLGN